MKGWGIALLVAGALVALVALFLDTTVEVPSIPAIGGYGGLDGGRTHNLGRLQAQELIFIGGCALFVAGAVLSGAGQIEAAIRDTRSAAVEQQSPGNVGDVADTSVAAPMIAIEEETDEAREERLAKSDAEFKRIMLGVIGAVLIMGLIVAVLIASKDRSSSEALAVEANAAAMANALEAEAERLNNMTEELTR